MNKLSRQEAWELLTEYTETPALQKHALQVAAAMEHFARLAGEGEDPDVWWVSGLLHDLDYEKYPEEHCRKAEQIMQERGVDEVYIRAMLCHGLRPLHRRKAREPDGKDALHHRRADRPGQRGLPGAAFQERAGPGSKVPQEKVQGQGLRRRGRPRGDPPGLRDAERPSGRHHAETIEGMKEHAGEIGLKGAL